MDVYEVTNRRTGARVVGRCGRATSFLARLRGLLGRKSLGRDEGLFFPDCSSIHMFMMCFAIDAVYVDAEMRVIKVVADLKPWRISMCAGARGVFEFASGVAAERDVRLGDPLRLERPDTVGGGRN